jgi:hypothetical protein
VLGVVQEALPHIKAAFPVARAHTHKGTHFPVGDPDRALGNELGARPQKAANPAVDPDQFPHPPTTPPRHPPHTHCTDEVDTDVPTDVAISSRPPLHREGGETGGEKNPGLPPPVSAPSAAVLSPRGSKVWAVTSGVFVCMCVCVCVWAWCEWECGGVFGCGCVQVYV